MDRDRGCISFLETNTLKLGNFVVGPLVTHDIRIWLVYPYLLHRKPINFHVESIIFSVLEIFSLHPNDLERILLTC